MKAVLPLMIVAILLLFFVAHSHQQTSNLTLSVATPIHYTTPNNPKAGATNTIKLGVVGVLALNYVALQVAVDYINSNTSILPDTKIELYASSTVVATPDTQVMFETLYQMTSLGVHGLIGPTTSTQTIVMQQVAKLYKIPQVGTIALSNALTDKALYPTFLRTISSDFSQTNGIIAFFKSCNWTKGVVVYSNNEYGLGFSQLVLSAALVNITLTTVASPVTGTTPAAFAPVADTVKQLADSGHNIFILYTSTITGNLMQALNNSGLSQPGHVFIITGDVANAARELGQYRVLDGMFGFGSGLAYGPEYTSIMNFWKARNGTKYTGIALNSYYAIDGVLAYAYAFDKLLKAGESFSNISTTKLQGALIPSKFYGTTGEVVIDSTGSRLGNFEIYNYYVNGNSTYERVATFSVNTQQFTKLKEYYFPGYELGKIPRDWPYVCPSCIHGKCVEDVGCVCDLGYTGQSCDVKKKGDTIIIEWLIPLLGVIVIASIGVYFLYKKKRSQLVKQVAEKQRSIIARSDLTLTSQIGRGASGEVWKGMYHGTDVAIKKIVTSHVDKQVIEDFEMEVAIMCGLRHPNIILFMGSCFDAQANEMLLVMEFMAKGSLNDVIHNPNIPLSYEMKLHIACQAAQGMNFLHQSTPPTIHLDLKSHNILLDDKWNARISDFGIAKFKEDSKKGSGQSIGTIYWTAPEALDGLKISEKCDCYSFGIVLWELFHQEMPYKGRDPVSVAVEVVRSDLRPTMSPKVPKEVQDLIVKCWDRNPDARPTFQEIMTTLRTLSLTAPVTNYGTATRNDAPTGLVYLVSTNVSGAFALWDAVPRVMEQSMSIHNESLRTNIAKYNGYEVATKDHTHSFTASFAEIDDAVNFCAAVQLSLLHLDWPADLLAQPLCAPKYDNNHTLIWRGLRVRMAMIAGVPNCSVDSNTNHMTYFGPVVEKLTKMLAVSQDAIILADDSIVDALSKKKTKLVEEVSFAKVGDIRGANAHLMTIKSLVRKASSSQSSSSGGTLPHVVVDVEEFVESEAELLGEDRPPTPSQIQLHKTVNWVALNSDILNKNPIGKGPIGDYFRASWQGKEVAVKVLVNQKLKENDLYKLIGDSAFMRSLNHPNLLSFHAICLEPGHLAILSDYMPKGNLKQLLADQSVQLSNARKITIALGIAQGLSFLTSLPDQCMRIHDNMKSNNVLLGNNGEVKIADYGHSNIRELARTMTSVGNIAWTAPEILDGRQSTPLIATYSFGIILWELWTRQVPYANEHPIRVVTKILGGFRPPLPANCLPAYKQLVEKCLDGEPENRPSWEAIINALSEIAKTV